MYGEQSNFRGSFMLGYWNTNQSISFSKPKYRPSVYYRQRSKNGSCQFPYRAFSDWQSFPEYYFRNKFSDLGLLGGFGPSVSQRPFSQAGSGALLPCVFTFSKDYDVSNPYFPQVNESEFLRLDSTFQPDPPQGWQRQRRRSASQEPASGPCTPSAS